MNEKKENIIIRPPVVVILGHVDHGKSSLLEAIKDLKITGKESGGITQHIGAYEIEHHGKKITFLDTPGHEAFSSMRSRGSRVADIAVLVVAADDGVKAQTKEAISHVKKAGIPMIVAINKMDKPSADPDKIIQQLSADEIYLESIGGKVPVVLVSAKTKEKIGDLLEMILLVSEMENLETDISLLPSGVIVESHLDPLKGPTTTVIVETGILKRGDILATSSVLGKIKNLEDFQGKTIDQVLPSMPAIVYGFESVPPIGDEFRVFLDSEEARKFIKEKQLHKAEPKQKISIATESLNVILKADFLGSLEAIEGMLAEINQNRIAIKVLKSEVGDINESDTKLAKSFGAIIFGFRVKASAQILPIIERDNVNILTFDVIYELIEKMRKVMERAITPRIERIDLGKLKVMILFFHEKNHQILGGKVIEGEMRKGAELEVVRFSPESDKEIEIGKGKIKGLKVGDKEMEKVGQGEECGISYEGNVKIEVGDVLQVYLMEQEKIDKI